MTDLEQQAREVLAAEYEADGHKDFAWEIRNGNLNRTGMGASIRAMLAFRAAQPVEGVDWGEPLAGSIHEPSDWQAPGPERESLAETLCNDLDARRIAEQEGAPLFADSASHVQGYWLRLADVIAALAKPRPDREAVARIIDPEQWRLHDAAIASANRLGGEPLGSVIAHDERERAASYVRGSLTKADTILALHPREQIAESANCSPAVPEVYLADRFHWAAPGDQQEDVWLVRFCDNDLREGIYNGPQAEADAWAAWNRHAPGYNMYVFRLATLPKPAPSIVGEAGWREERERLRAALREMVAAMRRYEMDVDGDPPGAHREMMRKAEALSEPQEQGEGKASPPQSPG